MLSRIKKIAVVFIIILAISGSTAAVLWNKISGNVQQFLHDVHFKNPVHVTTNHGSGPLNGKIIIVKK